jgi:hypothetical protein
VTDGGTAGASGRQQRTGDAKGRRR